MITAEEATATITSQANEIRLLRDTLGQFQEQHTAVVKQLQGEIANLQKSEPAPEPEKAKAQGNGKVA